MYLLKKISANHTLQVLAAFILYYIAGALVVIVLVNSNSYFQKSSYLLPDLLNTIATTYLYNFIFLIFPLITSAFASLFTHFFFRPYRDGFIYAFLSSVLIFFLFNSFIILSKVL